jgi:ketosteroid isomerase-like protein
MTADAFAAAVLARDLRAMERLLAEDVVFRSPAVFKPYEGKQATMVLLDAVTRVFEDFRYVRSYAEEGTEGHVLAFEATVAGRSLEGIDMLRFDDAGLIVDFRVMVRPLSGLQALVERMGQVIPEVMRERGLSA